MKFSKALALGLFLCFWEQSFDICGCGSSCIQEITLISYKTNINWLYVRLVISATHKN